MYKRQTWDEATNTLTLTDVTLTGDGTGVGIILPHGKVTVVLVGNSTIQNFGQGVSQTNAGSSKGNSLLITGSGSLAITGCNYMSQGSFEDVTVDGAVLAGNNTNGLILNGNFVGKNGANIDLTVKNNDSNVWNTIYANGSIEIYDSTLKSNSGASGGIWAVGVKKDSALIKFVNSNITPVSYTHLAGSTTVLTAPVHFLGRTKKPKRSPAQTRLSAVSMQPHLSVGRFIAAGEPP